MTEQEKKNGNDKKSFTLIAKAFGFQGYNPKGTTIEEKYPPVNDIKELRVVERIGQKGPYRQVEVDLADGRTIKAFLSKPGASDKIRNLTEENRKKAQEFIDKLQEEERKAAKK